MPVNETELQWPNKVLAGLQEMVADMIAEFAPQVVLQKAVDRMAELVGADIVTIHIYDPLTGRVRAAAGYGLLDGETFQRHRPGRGKAALLVANRGKPVIAENVSISEFAGPFSTREGVESAAGFPLKVSGKVTGVLFVSYREPHKFESEEVETIISFGNLAAVAIENAGLLKQERQRADALDLLQRVSATISAATNIEESMPLIVEGAVQLIKTEAAGVIHLIDESKKAISHSYEFPEGFGHLPSRFSEKVGLTWDVFNAKQMVEIHNVPQSERVSMALAQSDVKSLIGVPLKLEDHVLGVLFVNTFEHHEFMADEKAILTMLAEQAAIAIQNARLYEESRRRADTMELLQQVSARISTTLELEKTLDMIIKGAMELTGTESGVIHLVDEAHQTVIHSYEVPKGFGHLRPRLSNKTGMTWTAVSTGQTIAVPDITKDERVNPDMVEKGVKAIIGTPLKVEDKTIGVLFLNDSEVHEFTDYEKSWLVTVANQAASAIENARLFQESDERATQLERLQQITTRISATPSDLDEVLRLVVHSLGEIFEKASCTIRLYDAKTDRFEPKVATGLLADYVEAPPRDEGASRYVVKTKSPRYIVGDELAAPPDGGPAVRKGIRDRGIKASAHLPLVSEENIVGVLYIDLTVPREFSPNDRRILELFANQAAIAVENARLLEETVRRAEGIALANRMGRSLSDTRDMERIPQLLVKETLKLLDAEAGSLALINTETQEIEFQFALDYSGTERFDETMKGYRMPLDKGIAGAVVQSGEAVISNNVQEDPRWHSEVDSVTGFTTKSILTVPLIYGSQIIGVIEILNKRDGSPFIEQEEEILTTLALSAATAIENARLFKELEQRAAQLGQLQEITATISAQPPDIDKVLHLVVDKLGDIFQDPSCAIRLYDSRTNQFTPHIATGLLEDLVSRSPRPGGTSSYIIETKAPRYLERDELLSPSDGGPGVRQDIVDQGVEAAAYLPLVSDGDIIGILYVNLTESNQFSQDDRRILELFADQAAIAIENARLHSQRLQDLAALQEINEAITTASQAEIVQLIAQKAREVTQAEYIGLWTVAPEGDRLIPGAMVGPEPIETPKLAIDEHSINGWVAMTGDPYVCFDVENDPHYHKWVENVQSSVAFPLRFGGRVIGTLGAESTERDAFSKYQLDLLQALAAQAAIAIENAQLYTELHALFSAMSDVVIVYNKQGRYLNVVTESPPNLLYRPVDEMIDKTVHEVLPEHEADLCLQAIRDSLLHKKTVSAEYGLEIEGNKVWFEARVSPISEDTVIFVARDITARKQAEETLRQISEQRSKDIAALQEINEAVTSEARDEILERIVRTATEVMPGEYAELWLREPSTGDLILKAVFGPEERFLQHTARLRAGQKSVNVYVAQTGKPYICPNVEEIAEEVGFYRIYEAAQSSVTVPLRYRDEVTGTLNVESAQPNAFTEEHSRLLDSFAHQTAIAIESARLYRGLGVLSGIYEKIIAVGIENVDRLLDLLYEESCKIMDLSDAQVQIAFFDETRDEVSFPLAVEQDDGMIIDVVRWGKREERYRKSGENEIVKQFRPRVRGERRGLNEHVINTKESLLVTGDPQSDFQQKAEALGITVWPTFGRLDRRTHSWLGVPMIVRDRVTGVISIQSLEVEHSLGQDLIELLKAVANQAAIAIENANLYAEMEQRVEKRTRELEKAQERKAMVETWAKLGQVAAAVAHRVGNNAGVVRVKVKALYDQIPADPEITSSLQAIGRNNQYLLDLSELLLKPARAAREGLELLNINMLIKDAERKASIPSDIKVKMDLTEDLPEVAASPWFVEVFLELIANAIKAMEKCPEKSLEICSRLADDNWVEILVKDTGCGVPPDLRDKIFDLFLSGREETTGKGRGFGLWWIKAYLADVGSQVELLEPEPGGGATFVVRLPPPVVE